jgi:hypothetical protein
MFEELRLRQTRQRLEKLAAILVKRGYQVQIRDTLEAVRASVLELIGPGDSVGLGGSVTVRETGLDEALRAKAATVYDHWRPGADVAATVRQHPASDVFVTSTNAVTMGGELVNIDGTGNRVVSMIYGPKRVVAVIGANKLVNDRDAAIERLKAVACPLNARRRGSGLPCETTGRCQDCHALDNMCMVTTILSRRPATIDWHIILTPLELGF